MSMTAVFVQVSPEQISFLEANPSTAESLFQPDGVSPLAALGEMNEQMQERMRTTGPQMLAKALASLNPDLRQQLELKLGTTVGHLASGEGGDALLKLIQQRRDQALEIKKTGRKVLRRLDLDKDWHGVHYLLCGEPEQARRSSAKLCWAEHRLAMKMTRVSPATDRLDISPPPRLRNSAKH